MRFNDCKFVGRLGKDAKLRQVGEGSVANFSLAVDPFKKDGDTLWVSCSLWGRRADALEPYLVKGKPVLVSGELSLRSYDKDGQTRQSVELRVNDIVLLGGRDDNAPSGGRAIPPPDPDPGNGGNADLGGIPF